MIPDYHLYHGAVLASLVSGTGHPLTITSPQASGRAAEYIINNHIALYLKHATQRLRPWHFGFTPDNIKSITLLKEKYEKSFLVLICRQDGLIAVDLQTIINNIAPSGSLWIRADRGKRKKYRLYGPKGELPKKYDSNLISLKEALGINP
ncbi:hypothetical protein [Xanthomonas sp. LF06-19]|uniref:hypothetical protein n=1 Tax=Xanthomonas sp. LF06-19 TaxID=3097551 RepID=UPI002A841C49|nr:hypothetical protein [Xanthomonas sp. LF06-19]MDY4282681.1 hypothetical protein [Xanthomonas sp. LF06-19]